MGFFREVICTGVIRSLSKIYSPEFVGKLTGNADSATKLGTSGGSATQPVYFSGGKPVACKNTLGKSVPSDASFCKVISGVLNANSTSVTITNSNISSTSLIDVYTDNKDVSVSDLSISGTSLTLTFKESATTDTNLRIVVIKP